MPVTHGVASSSLVRTANNKALLKIQKGFFYAYNSRIFKKSGFFIQTAYLLIMRLFIKLRPFKEISLFSILIATLLSYALTFTTSSFISLVFIIVVCVLFVFHQLFLIGYKTNTTGETINNTLTYKLDDIYSLLQNTRNRNRTERKKANL